MGNINTYPDDATTTDNDRFFTYAADGSTKNTPASNVNKYLGPGWTIAGDTLTYSSWNSTTNTGVVNAASGANTKYQPGMWMKFTQPTLGTKYFKITASATSTVTIKSYDGSILSNEAITSPFYSAAKAPFGASQSGTVSSDEIDYSTTGGVWWEEVARATLASNTPGTTVLTAAIPAGKRRKYYHVIATVDRLASPAGLIWAGITINGDTGANYRNVGTVVDNSTTVTGQNALINYAGETRTAEYNTGIIELTVAKPGPTDYAAISTKGGSAIYSKHGSGWWQNSATITSFELRMLSGGSWAAGCEIIVLGHD